MATGTTDDARAATLSGSALWSVAVLLAAANFLAVLDMTIVNVSVPNIAGGLAVPPNEGTWVITSYSVAEAIIVPLTGWLAGRFGTVRVFALSILGFGMFSALCGLAPTLDLLVALRVLQGLSGGTLMPLSQTLLMQIFPKRQQPTAMTIWSMTTLVAPVLGPVLGGLLCNNFDWPSIFWVNVPIAMFCGPIVWRMLRTQETPTQRRRIDAVGLGLLVTWVAALQIVLDTGKDHDWFASTRITLLALLAAIGFAAFLIWELTCREPVVSLRVFRHRGFSASMVNLALAMGAFFAVNVLTPLWLQEQMGYTATWAGYASAGFGISAMLAAPLVAAIAHRTDPRKLIFAGVLWLALVTFLRSASDAQMTFAEVAWPVFLTGFGLPFFFIPLMTTALGSVDSQEIAAAAGQLNFVRSLSGAIATSIVTTVWENDATRAHAQLVGVLHGVRHTLAGLMQHGYSMAQAASLIDRTLNAQATMIATNRVFFFCALALAVAACAIWLSPKPNAEVDIAAIH
jgi:DHA2 family multidrug resistance protein